MDKPRIREKDIIIKMAIEKIFSTVADMSPGFEVAKDLRRIDELAILKHEGDKNLPVYRIFGDMKKFSVIELKSPADNYTSKMLSQLLANLHLFIKYKRYQFSEAAKKVQAIIVCPNLDHKSYKELIADKILVASDKTRPWIIKLAHEPFSVKIITTDNLPINRAYIDLLPFVSVSRAEAVYGFFKTVKITDENKDLLVWFAINNINNEKYMELINTTELMEKVIKMVGGLEKVIDVMGGPEEVIDAMGGPKEAIDAMGGPEKAQEIINSMLEEEKKNSKKK